MQWWLDFAYALLTVVAGACCAIIEWRAKHIEWMEYSPILFWVGIFAIAFGISVVVRLLLY